MDKSIIDLLIVSLPGVSQQVLKSTFTSRMDIHIVGVASGGLSAVRVMDKHQPNMVVIDSNMPETETSELIRTIKNRYSHTCALVLAETTQQLNLAVKLGADFALRAYELPSRLDGLLVMLSNSKIKSIENQKE